MTTALLQDKLVALVAPRFGREAAVAALAAIDALPRASDMAPRSPRSFRRTRSFGELRIALSGVEGRQPHERNQSQGTDFQEYRLAVRELCADFGSDYWQRSRRTRAYPEAFVKALTDAGWLSALIPEEYGGGGLGITEASVILEEINRSGANSGACHAQMYIMGALLRHGSGAQKQRYLPEIAAGALRCSRSPSPSRRRARTPRRRERSRSRRGDRYVVNGQKVWISRMQHSDLMLLLARTTPLPEVTKKTDGLSVFLVDLRGAEQGA